MRTIYTLIIFLFIALSSYRIVVEGVAEVDEAATKTDTEDSATSDESFADALTPTEESTESVPRKYRKTHKTKPLSVTETSSTSSIKSSVTSSTTTKDLSDNTHLDVISLNSRNFGKHISDGSVWLVEFYSPHCSHCVEFEALYSDIARYYHSQSISGTTKSKQSKKKQRSIKVGKVNGEIERALVSRFAIDSYPCFFLIDGFRVYKYGGLRLKKNLMAFAEGGYKKDASVPFIESPMGPLGIFQGTLMTAGHIFLDIFQWSQKTFGLSPLIVGMILFGAMFMGCFFLIVSLALIIPEKPKRA